MFCSQCAVRASARRRQTSFTRCATARAARMKKPVQNAGAAYKKAVGALGSATLDRMKNAVTYRIYICEDARAERYEHVLDDCEKTAVCSSVWQSSLPPLYLAASEGGVFFILLFGAENVLCSGWSAGTSPPSRRFSHALQS